MGSVEVTAAIIAGIVSIIGLIANYFITKRSERLQQDLQQTEHRASEERLRQEIEAKQAEWKTSLDAQEKQWQESFRAELRRTLVQESTLDVTRLRIKLYGEIWKALRITSQHEWRQHPNPKESVRQLAEKLTDFAYGEIGMVMSDRSRRMLNNLRSGCGQYLRDEVQDAELIDRAHILKHSLRSDLGILDYLYESDLATIADRLGKVDDWTDRAITHR